MHFVHKMSFAILAFDNFVHGNNVLISVLIYVPHSPRLGSAKDIITAPIYLICMFPCALECVRGCDCMCVGWLFYLRSHWQSCIEGLHSFVELSAEVEEHSQACLQVRVNAVRVVLNCFQEELFDLW